MFIVMLPGATLKLAPGYFVVPFQGERETPRRFKQTPVVEIEEVLLTAGCLS
jgi:hypothetical protein